VAAKRIQGVSIACRPARQTGAWACPTNEFLPKMTG
jgi:hypothetical protein